jgi:hypothetical protein
MGISGPDKNRRLQRSICVFGPSCIFVFFCQVRKKITSLTSPLSIPNPSPNHLLLLLLSSKLLGRDGIFEQNILKNLVFSKIFPDFNSEEENLMG